MRQLFIGCTFFFITSFISGNALADPWFTGPLLAPSGRTMPNGHTNVENYFFYTRNNGLFNNEGIIIDRPPSDSRVVNAILTHGISDSMDVQFSLPYVFNNNNGARSDQFGDTAATIGFQLIEQKDSKWRPNFRLTLQEIIPTGPYSELDPAYNGADSSGDGSYQTVLGLNFQHLAQLSETNYLRTRMTINLLYASSVPLEGVTSYGGTKDTSGTIYPGNLIGFDLAGELTLTQNWVAVMEFYTTRRGRTRFNGFPGKDEDGNLISIGRGNARLTTLAPAIEYNFSPNIGVIGGTWFTIGGRNVPNYIAYVVALNAFW